MNIIRIFSLLVVTSLVTGCGGGGGGGGFLAEPTAVIDSGNAQVIAGSVLTGNFALAITVGGSGGAVGSQSATERPRALLRLVAADATRSAISAAAGSAGSVQPLVTIPPSTDPCLVSGTMTVWGSVANPLNFGPGDVLNATFLDCDDGDGDVLDGMMSLRLTSFTGDAQSGAFRLVADTTFSDLTVTDGTDTGTMDGTGTLTIDTRDPLLGYVRLVTEGIQFTANGVLYVLTGYDAASDTALDTLVYTLEVTGHMQDSSTYTGAIRVNTLTTVSGDVGNFPSTGELLITGAANSTIDVEAVDATNVLLHIDADGDGFAEEDRQLTWSELVPG
jgi:hypothetical protein